VQPFVQPLDFFCNFGCTNKRKAMMKPATKAVIKPVFNARNRLNKHGKGAIHVYVYMDGTRKFIPTNLTVAPDQWDSTKEAVNKKHPNYIKLNHFIAQIITELERFEFSLMDQGRSLTAYHIDRYLDQDGGKDSFIAFLKQEIDDDNTVTLGTMQYRKVMLEKLKSAAGDNVPFSEVNYELIDRFNNYMSKEGLGLNTMRKYHRQLNKFISVAVKKRLLKENPYKDYKVKSPPRTLKNALMQEDIDRIWKLEYDDNSPQELARLKFLFSCYTGLRISDNTALTWEAIRGDRLVLTQQKTGQSVVIPLNLIDDRPQQIIEKAKRIYNHATLVFKPMPDQKVNSVLKTIAIDSESPFPLNFHISRHSFCTRIAMQTGSVFDVMRYAGIVKVDTAMVYVNLARMFEAST